MNAACTYSQDDAVRLSSTANGYSCSMNTTWNASVRFSPTLWSVSLNTHSHEAEHDDDAVDHEQDERQTGLRDVVETPAGLVTRYSEKLSTSRSGTKASNVSLSSERFYMFTSTEENDIL